MAGKANAQTNASANDNDGGDYSNHEPFARTSPLASRRWLILLVGGGNAVIARMAVDGTARVETHGSEEEKGILRRDGQLTTACWARKRRVIQVNVLEK